MDMITYAALQKQIRESAGGSGETQAEVFHVATISDDSGNHINCSFDELFNAVESEKIIIFDARQTIVTSYTAKRIRLAVLERGGYEEWTIKQDGSATEDYSESYVSNTNKSEEINESSTDEQWATAKAVYDFVHAYADSFAGGPSGGGEGDSGGSAAAPFIFDLVIGGDENYEAYELPEGVTYNDLCNAYNARRQVFAHVVSKSGNFDLMVPLVGIAPFYGTDLVDVNDFGHILQFSTQIVGQFCVFFNVFWDGWVNCDGSLDQLLEM